MDTPSATPQSAGEGPAAGWPAFAATVDWPAGWHVEAVDDTGSTNTDLLQAARDGAPDRSVLAAAHQSAGRGRLDRKWDAPPGANLLVSILLRDPPAALHEVTQRVALAGARAAARVARVDARLKWPNDLLVDGAKLAGVLAQAGTTPGRGVDHVVVGIGVNVNWSPQGAARLVAEPADEHTAEGRPHVLHPLTVLRELLVAFDELPADVHEQYRRSLVTIGQRVRVELPAGVLEGRAVDVERDGRLVVLDDCGLSSRVDTGDVVHLRPAT